MQTIKEINIKNFRCYRKRISISAEGATYLIGANNCGKSAALHAIKHFFSPIPIAKDDFNSTELRSKQAGHNKCEIEITFTLENIDPNKSATRIGKIKKEYGKEFTIKKIYTYKESTEEIEIDFEVVNEAKAVVSTSKTLPDQLDWFLSKHSLSYIHPQDSDNLLSEAESKLRKRLINTFGKGPVYASKMSTLKDSWSVLKDEASKSLSEHLSSALKTVWPDATAQVDLPEKIEDILSISSISFRQTANQPEILLNRQGNGVQAAALFQAHYILDSDKTEHRGFHQPVWLVEEPETFLHADIALKLGQLLTSKEWLSNIQLIATTHSPLILAAANQSKQNCNIALIKNANVSFDKLLSNLTTSEIQDIGAEIGDTNFDIYLEANSSQEQIIIEDTRKETLEAYQRANINITKSVNGTTDVKKLLDFSVKLSLPPRKRITVILDQDDGISEIKQYISKKTETKTINDFELHKIIENLYILLLPPEDAVEDLFDEYDDHLEEAADILFDDDYKFASTSNIPGYYSRAHAKIRNRTAGSRQEAKKLITKEQDIKDEFWKKVAKHKYKFSEKAQTSIKALLTEK